MTERMKQISLRKFRTEIADISEAVEVSRRGTGGGISILGYWTPYRTITDVQLMHISLDSKAAPKPTTGRGASVAVEVDQDQTVMGVSLASSVTDLVAAGHLHLPVEDEPEFPMGEDSEFDRHPRTAVIKTPAEAAVAVRADPVRAVPKPSQRKKR